MAEGERSAGEVKRFQKTAKLLTDACMLALFIYLMSYRVTRELAWHAIFGAVLFALFALHHILNFRFYRTLFRGKYAFRRVLLLISDLLLTASMLFMAASSLGMSGTVVDLGIAMTQTARDTHVVSTAWRYVLMALHLGFHLNLLFVKIENRTKGTVWEFTVYVLFAVCGVFGGISFLKSGLWQDMFLLRREHAYLSLPLFLAEYVGILFFGMILMHIVLLLERSKKACRARPILDA